MRNVLFLGFIVSIAALASELKVSTVQGTGIKSFIGSPGAHYSIQCPNVDAGPGQAVFYRPGCPTRADGGVTCVVDAGVGDLIMDFTANSDPYKIDLAVTEDRIHMANSSSYATAILCNVYRRNP